jgi:hypothetical protein
MNPKFQYGPGDEITWGQVIHESDPRYDERGPDSSPFCEDCPLMADCPLLKGGLCPEVV